MRVLVVEDELDLGDVFRDFLLELGHQPLVVRSAEAALGKLETERPDAIILDIHLPGMSGLDFLQLRPVRELGVPIVAVSGVVTESQARECLRLGAADFVGKPIPLDRLNEVLTFLEPHAMSRRVDKARPADRRRKPRARVTFPVRALEYNGAEHHGTSVEIGVSGIKVRLPSALEPGNVVRLTFTLPDGGPGIQTMSLVVRVDPDGHAFTFVHLAEQDTERLAELIQRRR
ncbi:MAG: response regulator [Candidatus Rokubacteria bacterium]|nr:response regulator [Candidatus Rokubacteria bacterium]MBI4255439.1 response regulator [Candidatus Rokubacteria bacterium]MBI4628962.1 response regulator [Candidatus Rokubacteria bacterium]